MLSCCVAVLRALVTCPCRKFRRFTALDPPDALDLPHLLDDDAREMRCLALPPPGPGPLCIE